MRPFQGLLKPDPLMQADGPSTRVLGFEPLAGKWRAFGRFGQRVDGNDIAAVTRTFDAVRP